MTARPEPDEQGDRRQQQRVGVRRHLRTTRCATTQSAVDPALKPAISGQQRAGDRRRSTMHCASTVIRSTAKPSSAASVPRRVGTGVGGGRGARGSVAGRGRQSALRQSPRGSDDEVVGRRRRGAGSARSGAGVAGVPGRTGVGATVVGVGVGVGAGVGWQSGGCWSRRASQDPVGVGLASSAVMPSAHPAAGRRGQVGEPQGRCPRRLERGRSRRSSAVRGRGRRRPARPRCAPDEAVRLGPDAQPDRARDEHDENEHRQQDGGRSGRRRAAAPPPVGGVGVRRRPGGAVEGGAPGRRSWRRPPAARRAAGRRRPRRP